MQKRRVSTGWTAVLLVFLLVAVASGAEKRFGGVGLQVVPTVDGNLVVLKVVDGSPAMEGGLRPGDLIIQVDDFLLRGSDFSEVVSRYLWGEIGTLLTLKYLRPGKTGIHTATLRRVAMNPRAAAPPGVKMISPPEK
jgi:C-terminal processing protease CtpA/Prc